MYRSEEVKKYRSEEVKKWRKGESKLYSIYFNK
jgi:hypothetical protein